MPWTEGKVAHKYLLNLNSPTRVSGNDGEPARRVSSFTSQRPVPAPAADPVRFLVGTQKAVRRWHARLQMKPSWLAWPGFRIADREPRCKVPTLLLTRPGWTE